MPHISKKFVNKEVFQKINSGLIFYLSKLSDKDSKLMVGELLTKTEKLMIAKRMAVICLLSDGTPQNEIYHMLKMSPSTIARLGLNLEMGKYNSFIKMIKRKKNEIFWKNLGNLLRGGLPPKGVRWKHYREDIY